MTEIVTPEPISAQSLRTAAVAELIATSALLTHLDVDGLCGVRYRLREAALGRWCFSRVADGADVIALGQ